MHISQTLERALELWPDRQAIADGALRFTYRELGERVARLAGGLLREVGLRSGDVATIVAPNVHEYLEAYYACAAAGVVLRPINHRLAPREIAEILTRSGARACLGHVSFAPAVAGALEGANDVGHVIWIGLGETPPVRVATTGYEELLGNAAPLAARSEAAPDSLAHLYYTSGTTGAPKGVMLTHGNVVTHALTAVAELGLSDADTWLHAAPLFHLADAWATFAITWVGGRHVCLPTFEPTAALAVMETEGVTITNLVPTMLRAMAHHESASDHDYSSLRVLLSGGAPIAPETVRRIVETFGCDYVQTYGMTETSPYLTLSLLEEHQKELPPAEQLRIKSRTGRPVMGVELRVVREDGTAVQRDDREVGEIIVRGPTVTPGYYEDPEATAEAFSAGGWLHTGDLAVIDAEGSVNIVDRKKDTIVTGGENVHSTEVEHVLYDHPDVLECAVVGVPDDLWGEAVKAVVVLRPGRQGDPQSIIDHARAHLAHYKAPKTVDFVSELPKTGSGKIAKRMIRERFWSGSGKRIG